MTHDVSSHQRTAQQKLASRSWRVLNSWWILVPLLSLGLLGWISFLVAGAQLSRAKYWISAVVYGALVVVCAATTRSNGSVQSTVFAVCMFAAWLGATGQTMMMNRRYLTELAQRRPWREVALAELQAQSAPRPTAQPSQPVLSSPPPVQAPAAPGPDYYYGPSTSEAAQPAMLDVNAASLEELAGLDAVGAELAHRLVATRTRRGGFSDLDDLAFAVGLRPHECVRIADHVYFGQPDPGFQPRS